MNSVISQSAFPPNSPSCGRAEPRPLLAIQVKKRPVLAHFCKLQNSAIIECGFGAEEVMAVGMVKFHEEFHLVQYFLRFIFGVYVSVCDWFSAHVCMYTYAYMDVCIYMYMRTCEQTYYIQLFLKNIAQNVL